MSKWPAPGDRVVVWSERTPSRTPRDPHGSTVDHVAGRTFTVNGLAATFNRSTGRSKPIRRGAGAFASDTYVAVAADSSRARQVLGDAVRGELEATAVEAVRAWLGDRSEQTRRVAIDALQALDERH